MAFFLFLKSAKVILTYKKNSSVVVSNYRAMSLLSNLNIEKLIYKQIIQFLWDKKFIFYKQFRFRKNFSTTDVVITLIKDLQSAIENSKFACEVFIDLEKGFDTVNHNILPSRINYYGIRDVTNVWFECYLVNWSQFVSINETDLDHQPLTCGVPRGSVLWRLIFLIFINNLNFAIWNLSTFLFC